MALYPNGRYLTRSPGRHFGGNTAAVGGSGVGYSPLVMNRGDRFNRFLSDNYLEVSSTPEGYGISGYVQSRQPGSLSSNVSGAGALSSTAQSGFNLDAALTGDGGITNAPLGLIVTLVAAIIGSGGVSSATTQALTTLVAALTGSGNITATGKGLADLAATLTGAGSVTANNTALMNIAAQIRGYGDLTPEGIRDSVWNAVLANYQTDGSAGKALSTASSGGVDLNALAAAVWAYATRTLTAGGGTAPTAEEVATAILNAAQTTPIHADIRKVKGQTVNGAGSEADPWGP